MTTLHALANQTKYDFNGFKNDTESSLLLVRVWICFSITPFLWLKVSKNIVNSYDNDKQKRNSNGDSSKEDEEPAVTVLIILMVPLMTPCSLCPSSSQPVYRIGKGWAGDEVF